MIRCPKCALLALYLFDDKCVWCLEVKEVEVMQRDWKKNGRKSKRLKE